MQKQLYKIMNNVKKEKLLIVEGELSSLMQLGGITLPKLVSK